MKTWPARNASTGEGGVPAGLDAISVDIYDKTNTDGAGEIAKNKEFCTPLSAQLLSLFSLGGDTSSSQIS